MSKYLKINNLSYKYPDGHKALNDIKKEVVDLSISVAEKLINKNLSDADNREMIKESLKKVKQYEA